MHRVRWLCFVFFFQAEDGIRDVAVTGVQTCALPISKHLKSWKRKTPVPIGTAPGIPIPQRSFEPLPLLWTAKGRPLFGKPPPATASRSEERRVGKECRSRGLHAQQRRNVRKTVHTRL